MASELRISKEALAHLSAMASSSELDSRAVFVGAMLEQGPPPLAAGGSIEEYVTKALANYEQSSLPTRVRWIVWIAESGSVPASHLREIKGIPFAVPDELVAVVGDRELILENGTLRFEPEYGELRM